MPTFAIDTFDQERFGIITGSRCSPLVPKRDAKKGMDNLARELAQEKYFQFYDEHSTWQTEHGKMAEPFALQYYQENYDPDMVEGRWRKVGETGGTTDAENEEQGYGVDFKCPVSLEGWLDFLFHDLKNHKVYYDQAQLYMRISGYKLWKVCAFLIETNFMDNNQLSYPVANDKRMIVVDVPYDPDWHKLFEENMPVVIEDRDKYYKQLVKHFGEK